jgi:hypothetical protein
MLYQKTLGRSALLLSDGCALFPNPFSSSAPGLRSINEKFKNLGASGATEILFFRCQEFGPLCSTPFEVPLHLFQSGDGVDDGGMVFAAENLADLLVVDS